MDQAFINIVERETNDNDSALGLRTELVVLKEECACQSTETQTNRDLQVISVRKMEITLQIAVKKKCILLTDIIMILFKEFP